VNVADSFYGCDERGLTRSGVSSPTKHREPGTHCQQEQWMFFGEPESVEKVVRRKKKPEIPFKRILDREDESRI
jgi:hypothetical protein